MAFRTFLIQNYFLSDLKYCYKSAEIIMKILLWRVKCGLASLRTALQVSSKFTVLVIDLSGVFKRETTTI